MVKGQTKSQYTYLWLRENGSVYYVGKGSGYRATTKKGHLCNPPTDRARIIIQDFPTAADALLAEKILIAYYGRIDVGTGCLRNRTDGGENPPSHLGRKKSKEHKRKISEAKRGKKRPPFSQEWLRKLSEAHRDQRGNTYNLGKKRSAETCSKMSTSMKRRWELSPEIWIAPSASAQLPLFESAAVLSLA